MEVTNVRLWGAVWVLAAVAGGWLALIERGVEPTSEVFLTTFPTCLWLLGGLVGYCYRRLSLGLMTAPLLCLMLGFVSWGTHLQLLWFLSVLFGLRMITGGTSLGSLLWSLLTWTAAVVLAGLDLLAALPFCLFGSCVLAAHALLLGWLRSRGKLDLLLQRLARLSWVALYTTALTGVAGILIGAVASGGRSLEGGGLLLLLVMRAGYTWLKEAQPER